MAFHDVHSVKAGDNLTNIAREYGYDNPGPIHAYPPNQLLFRGRSPSLIRPGEKIHVPYHPNLLKKIIATSKHLIDETTKDVTKLMQAHNVLKKDLECFLFKVDAANMLANVGVGIGALVAKGPGATMTGKEALIWLAESRANVGAGVATLAIPAPEAPRRDFNWFVRHTLGPWNPSFWASVFVAIKEGDADIYLHGADATTYKRKLEIKKQAEADIAALRKRWNDGQAQLNQSFYRARL